MSSAEICRFQFRDFFLFSQKNRLWQFMRIVSFADDFQEMSKPIFLG